MKIGRNEPCPCGSGKKFKKCCLKKDSYSNSKSIEDLLTPECQEIRNRFNNILRQSLETIYHVVDMYETIESEIDNIQQFLSCNQLTHYENASLYFYIATYYSKLFDYRKKYRVSIICEKKIEHGIHPQDNDNLVEVKAEEEKRINDDKIKLATKSNKYFILAENEISQLSLKEDARFSSLYLNIKINLFNNISHITPLLSLMLIEDFEKICEVKLDIYNSIQLEISYLTADYYLMKFRNNCPDEMLLTIEMNCRYRLNLIMYKLSYAHEEAPDIVNEEFVNEMLYKIKKFSNNIPEYLEFTRNGSTTYKVNMDLLKDTYCDLKKYIFEWDIIAKFVFSDSLYHIYEEMKHNYCFSDSDSYEVLYKVSQKFNMLDKISYAILDYIKEDNDDEKLYSLKYLFEKKDMYKHNEPNFREVTNYIGILNNFNNTSYFKEIGQLMDLRNSITHKPINIEDIEDDYISSIIEAKTKLDSYTLVFLLLTYIAFLIDFECKKEN